MRVNSMAELSAGYRSLVQGICCSRIVAGAVVEGDCGDDGYAEEPKLLAGRGKGNSNAGSWVKTDIMMEEVRRAGAGMGGGGGDAGGCEAEAACPPALSAAAGAAATRTKSCACVLPVACLQGVLHAATAARPLKRYPLTAHAHTRCHLPCAAPPPLPVCSTSMAPRSTWTWSCRAARPCTPP